MKMSGCEPGVVMFLQNPLLTPKLAVLTQKLSTKAPVQGLTSITLCIQKWTTHQR